MVNIGQSRRDAILKVDFSASVGNPSGVDVMTLADLRRRAPHGFGKPQRPGFHHLIAPTEGTLHQEVDFTTYEVESGTWLWVRPGQVQTWGDISQVEGRLVLFEPDFLEPATVTAGRLESVGNPVLYAAGGDRGIGLAVEHLEHEFGSFGSSPPGVHIAMLRHLLSVLVLRLAHLPADLVEDTGANHTFSRFREAVERDFTRTRNVADYARTLGYSPRTLTRAAAASVGINAKQFIADRVILEAKRQLAHSDHTAAQIAGQLGFSSPTNFSKYFRAHAGQSPSQFRASTRHSPELS